MEKLKLFLQQLLSTQADSATPISMFEDVPILIDIICSLSGSIYASGSMNTKGLNPSHDLKSTRSDLFEYFSICIYKLFDILCSINLSVLECHEYSPDESNSASLYQYFDVAMIVLRILDKLMSLYDSWMQYIVKFVELHDETMTDNNPDTFNSSVKLNQIKKVDILPYLDCYREFTVRVTNLCENLLQQDWLGLDDDEQSDMSSNHDERKIKAANSSQKRKYSIKDLGLILSLFFKHHSITNISEKIHVLHILSSDILVSLISPSNDHRDDSDNDELVVSQQNKKKLSSRLTQSPKKIVKNTKNSKKSNKVHGEYKMLCEDSLILFYNSLLSEVCHVYEILTKKYHENRNVDKNSMSKNIYEALEVKEAANDSKEDEVLLDDLNILVGLTSSDINSFNL